MSTFPVRSPLPKSVPSPPLGARHHRKLRGCHPRAPVIVWMEADDDAAPTADVTAEPLDLIGIDVGRRHFDRGGEIQDGLAFGSRLPYGGHGIADPHREIEFRARKTLG